MSDVILAVARNLQAIRELMPEIIREVIQENASLIEDMNIAQLQAGQRADGSTLPNYSPTSVIKYGKPPGPIRLFDTGDFYRGITVRPFNDRLELDNTDSKIGKLANRYGDEIIGLQEGNIEDLRRFILLPSLQEKVRDLI
jgi:hypothetical protein